MREMVAQNHVPSSNESDGDDKRRSVSGLALWIMLATNHHELPRTESTIWSSWNPVSTYRRVIYLELEVSTCIKPVRR